MTAGAARESWSRGEEELCDHGAAELLLPREAFIAACPPYPDMADVLTLAQTFQASAEATALRVVTLSAVPAAMMVLEPSLKPAEVSRIAHRQSQPALPGFPPEAPALRLRVQKSFRYRFPFLPKHKSIDASTPLASVLDDGAADYTGQTGIIPGRFRVSARLLPISRDGILVDRVVALLFYPDADSWAMRQSG